MRAQAVCFSGHRVVPDGEYESLKEKVTNEIVQLIGQGYYLFYTGGALGFDTLAAQAVLKARGEFPQVKLILALPCPSQAERWCEHDKMIYEQIKQMADEVVYTSEEYTRGCMFKRNRYLVDNSCVCVCYLTASTGGTVYTVDYARKQGLKVINVAEIPEE